MIENITVTISNSPALTVAATVIAGIPGVDGVDGVGVPAGGTTGQVLGKSSADDFDTEWVDQTGGDGGTALTSYASQVATLPDYPASFPPSSHSHGSLTNDGKIGTVAALPIITSTGGLVVAGAWGTTSGTFCQGDDSRLALAASSLQPSGDISVSSITFADASITPSGTGGFVIASTGSGTITIQSGSGSTITGGALTVDCDLIFAASVFSFTGIGGQAAFLTALGATATGTALLTAADAAAAQTAIGATSTGSALLTAANAAAAATAAGVGTADEVTHKRITVAGGTLTASAPNMATQTWNNPAVTFEADVVSITNTASGAASTLIDRKVAGVSKFKVDTSGAIYITAAGPKLLTQSGELGVQNAVGSAWAYILCGGLKIIQGEFKPYRTDVAAGTTGAQTINKPAGSVNLAAGATSLVVTNSLVAAASRVLVTVNTNDTTCKSCAALSAAGSFTIYPNAAPTAETNVSFLVLS